MKMIKHTILLIFLIVSVFPAATYSLSELNESDMRSSRAQAGVSIAVENALIQTKHDSLTLSDPDDLSSYITFTELNYINLINCGVEDINGDNRIDPLTIDVFTVNDTMSPADGQTFIYFDAPDWDAKNSITVSQINVAGTDIGSATITNLNQRSFELYLGAHDSGLDIQYGQAVTIESVAYEYNTTDSLTFSGIHIAGSFSGDPSDPSTWSSSGMFTFGDVLNGRPATFDIGVDSSSVHVIERAPEDGGNYTVANPRAGSAYVSIDAPMQGSLRVENVNFGGTDMGPIAIDGIDMTTFHVEFPGRGLGN